jgi:hypothetical protein
MEVFGWEVVGLIRVLLEVSCNFSGMTTRNR